MPPLNIAVIHNYMRPRHAIAIPVSPSRMVGHEQRNIQAVAVQFQIFQREPHPQLYLISEQFLEFSGTLAAEVGVGLYLDWKDIVSPLNQEIHLVRRINLVPISRRCLELRNQRLKHIIIDYHAQALSLCEVSLS